MFTNFDPNFDKNSFLFCYRMLKESIFVREGGALNLFQSLVHSLKDVLINFAGFRIMCQKLWQFSTRRNCYPAIYGRIERFAKTHNWWQHQTKNPWNASNLGNGFSKFSSLSNCYSESLVQCVIINNSL